MLGKQFYTFKIDVSIDTQTLLILLLPLTMSFSKWMEAFLSSCLFSKPDLPFKIVFAVAPSHLLLSQFILVKRIVVPNSYTLFN